MNPDEDPLEQLLKTKAPPQQADPLDELMKGKTPARRPKIGQMGIPISDDSPEAPSYAQKALGGIAALAHDIPGAEAAQAGARSFFRAHATGKPNMFGYVPTESDQTYSEALGDIKSAENAAPKGVRILNNVAGGTVAALAAPKGPWMNPLGTGGTAAVQGARFGAAQGALSAEPGSIEDRLIRAGKGGAIASVTAGLLGDVAPKVARVMAAKGLGANAMHRGAQMTAADQAAYGQALAQGKGQVHPDVTAALDSPGISGYAKAARNSPSLAGADDATILHETYKRLGERQRGLSAQVERAADFKAGPAREIQDIELMKQRLLDAADKIMPGYRQAVQGHADLAGQYDAFTDAADQTRRIIKGTSVAGRNLQKNTGDAFKANIIKLDKAKAEAAREAVLGRVQEQAGEHLSGNPLKGFGTNPFGLTGAMRSINKASPYLEMLDGKIDPNAGILRRALAASVGSHAGN